MKFNLFVLIFLTISVLSLSVIAGEENTPQRKNKVYCLENESGAKPYECLNKQKDTFQVHSLNIF